MQFTTAPAVSNARPGKQCSTLLAHFPPTRYLSTVANPAAVAAAEVAAQRRLTPAAAIAAAAKLGPAAAALAAAPIPAGRSGGALVLELPKAGGKRKAAAAALGQGAAARAGGSKRRTSGSGSGGGTSVSSGAGDAGLEIELEDDEGERLLLGSGSGSGLDPTAAARERAIELLRAAGGPACFMFSLLRFLCDQVLARLPCKQAMTELLLCCLFRPAGMPAADPPTPYRLALRCTGGAKAPDPNSSNKVPDALAASVRRMDAERRSSAGTAGTADEVQEEQPGPSSGGSGRQVLGQVQPAAQQAQQAQQQQKQQHRTPPVPSVVAGGAGAARPPPTAPRPAAAAAVAGGRPSRPAAAAGPKPAAAKAAEAPRSAMEAAFGAVVGDEAAAAAKGTRCAAGLGMLWHGRRRLRRVCRGLGRVDGAMGAEQRRRLTLALASFGSQVGTRVAPLLRAPLLTGFRFVLLVLPAGTRTWWMTKSMRSWTRWAGGRCRQPAARCHHHPLPRRLYARPRSKQAAACCSPSAVKSSIVAH